MNDFIVLRNELPLLNGSYMTMKRVPGKLSTADVAELLGVHPSTVKRWFRGSPGAAAAGRVATTSGGHRRIPLDVALRVASERGHRVYLHAFAAEAAFVWSAIRSLDAGRPKPAQDLLLDWLKSRRTHLIGRFLRHVTSLEPVVDPAILDSVLGAFMRRVGDGWARGDLRISDERAASREVAESIYALLDPVVREDNRPDPASPTAIVATVEPDRHILGSLLVRLVLAQRGWNVEYLGTGLPIAEIVATQHRTQASLVCVSFSPPRGAADVRRFVDVACRLTDPCHTYSLLLGGGGTRGVEFGPGDWPFDDLGILHSLAELGDWLERRHHVRGSPRLHGGARHVRVRR